MKPLHHYAPANNWLSDPNGLVFHRGEWHLFYQYNPFSEDWGHMSWGHAVSPDLVSWRELPIALPEREGEAAFSGSAVIDAANCAGFGAGAMIAIYTGARSEPKQRQAQCLAYSLDDGRTWTRYSGNPVLDRAAADFRDPNVFWHGATRQWVMVVVLSAEHRALIYGSADLRHWQELAQIGSMGAPGSIWECPLLIDVPIEGSTERRWLFKVDVLADAPGSGALYCTGRFDGSSFVADSSADGRIWHVADWGTDFYAAIAWHEPRDDRGRPVWLGWMGNHLYQGQLPPQGWRGAMSLPRRLSLVRDAAGYRLRQTIEPALLAPQFRALRQRDGQMRPGWIQTEPQAIEMLRLHDRFGRSISVQRAGAAITVARQDPVTPALDLERTVPFDPQASCILWVDYGSVEILADDGSMCLTIQHRLDALISS